MRAKSNFCGGFSSCCCCCVEVDCDSDFDNWLSQGAGCVALPSRTALALLL